MSKKREKAESFKAEVEQKIQDLIAEFTEGQVSREQFNLLYDRYNGQLDIANQALTDNDNRALHEVQNSVPTIFVKEATTGKAIGMAIYHHRTGRFIESLGDFDVPIAQLTPVLNEVVGKVEASEFVEPKSVKIDRGQWVLFETRKYTTVVTVFRNEPSGIQIRELQRLHHDFEVANQRFLVTDKVDITALGYPFLSIIQRKLKR